MITIDTKKWNTQWTKKILRLSESCSSYNNTYFWNVPFFQENIWEIRLLNSYTYPNMEITFDFCRREPLEYSFHVSGDAIIRPKQKSFSTINASFKIDNREIVLFPSKFITYVTSVTPRFSTIKYKLAHNINTPFINGEVIRIRHPKFYYDGLVVYDSSVFDASIDIPLTDISVFDIAQLKEIEVYVKNRDLTFVLELIHKKV